MPTARRCSGSHDVIDIAIRSVSNVGSGGPGGVADTKIGVQPGTTGERIV